MTTPIGVQLPELTQAGSLLSSDFLLIQRLGQVANKITLNNLSTYLNVSGQITASINALISSTDPLGDRAFASAAIASHTGGSDPHGDRAFTSTSITTHSSASDPHGDRAFTSSAVTTHSAASDPHGDRAFTSAAISTHAGAADPHGDRAYTNAQITAASGTTLAPLVSGTIPTMYLPSSSNSTVFANFASFPVTGVVDRLYISKDTKLEYIWSGSAYVQLNSTTDTVAPGSNIDRKYLTDAQKTSFTAKVDDVVSEIDVSALNIFSRRTGNSVYIKTLNAEYPFSNVSTSTSVHIVDNIYKYSAADDLVSVVLENDNALKPDDLLAFDPEYLYDISGHVFAYIKELDGTTPAVGVFNRWKVEAVATTQVTTTPVGSILTAVVNSAGTNLSGTGPASKTLEVYDETFTLRGTTAIDSSGNYSFTISPAIVNGTALHLYVTTVAGERSPVFTTYTPNTGTLRTITNIGVTPDGLTISGIAERNATVTIADATPTTLGTPTSDANGFWTLTLGVALTLAQVLTISSSTAAGGSTSGLSYTVDFTTVEAPSYVQVSNNRKIISGKGIPNSIVNLYDDTGTPVFIQSYNVDANGDFTGSLLNIPTSVDEFNLTSSVASIESSNTNLLLRPYIVEAIIPVIGIVTGSSFVFLYKDIESRNKSPELDFSLDIIGANIILTGTNNTGKSVEWNAVLKIDKQDL